jgi:3-hydroxyisobutyrate dehydrogenase-like beta-hydroxyacid dehydrogenase
MGKHMATNLVAANHRVTVFDVNPQAFDHFKDQSQKNFSFFSTKINSIIIFIEQVKIVSGPQNAVENSEFVILMLPNGKIVRDVCQSNVFS